MPSKLIALDMDGVVADSHKAWVSRYNEQWCDTLRVEDITGWHMHDFVKPECGKQVYEILADGGLYDEILPVRNAQTGVEVLRSRGFRIIFVTSCFAGTADAKYRWLTRHGFLHRSPVNRDYVVCTDKHLIRADALVDDKPENLTEFKGKKILYSQPWNRLSPAQGLLRADTWLDVIHHLTGR